VTRARSWARGWLLGYCEKTRVRSIPTIGLLLTAIGMLVARTAHADDEVATCTTQTARSPGEIVIRASVYARDPPGVTVVDGETLCLAGSIDLDGIVRGLRLAGGDGDPPILLLRLDAYGPVRILHVRTSVPRWLGFDLSVAAYGTEVLVPSTPGANPEGAPTVPEFLPAQSVRTQRDGMDLALPTKTGARELFLHPFWFGSPGATAPDVVIARRRSSTSLADRKFELGFSLLAGTRLVRSFQGLDQALEANGYGPFSSTLPSWAAFLDVAFRRWRFRLLFDGGWTSAESQTGDGHIGANLVAGRLDAGYDFLRWRGLTGYALAGIGGVTFTMGARAPHWNYLGSQAATLGNPDEINRDAWLLTLATGFQQIIPFGSPLRGNWWGLILSLEGGYTQQLGLGSWFANDQDNHGSVAGTKALDLGGTFVSFGVGIGVFAPE
jgi:hypothetical protein